MESEDSGFRRRDRAMARDRRHWLSSERGEKWRTSLSRRNHFEITGGEGYQRYGVVMVRGEGYQSWK